MVSGIRLNGVHYLLTRFLDVQKYPRNTKVITFDGSITTLLEGVGCRNLGSRVIQKGIIDRGTLINMHILIQSANDRQSAHRFASRSEMCRLCGRPGEYIQPQEHPTDTSSLILQRLTELRDGQLELR